MKKYNYLDIASFVEELMEKKESAETCLCKKCS